MIIKNCNVPIYTGKRVPFPKTHKGIMGKYINLRWCLYLNVQSLHYWLNSCKLFIPKYIFYAVIYIQLKFVLLLAWIDC